MNKHLSNDRGFALLLSFVILFISSSLLLHFLMVYESEKEFVMMEKNMNTLEHLLLHSSEYVIRSLPLDDEDGSLEGSYHYVEGTAYYKINEEDEFYLITIRAILENESEKSCKFSYVKETGEIIYWEERVNM